jgi:predicted permease
MLGNADAEEAISMHPDPTVLCVTAACAVFCALLFGMAPAWTASHISVEAALRNSNPRTSAGGRGLLNLFVPLQVALSLALVVVAGLLGTTVARLLTEDSGYRQNNVIFALTDFQRIPQKGPELVALYRRMAELIEERPGVEQASVASIAPFLGWRWTDQFVAAENAQHSQPVQAMENVVTAHYFSAVGVYILVGRDLENSDSDANSCVISEAAARLYFPHALALGKTLQRVSHSAEGHDVSRNYQVVGIVQDTKYDSVRESPPPIVYIPLANLDGGGTNGGYSLFFVVHASSMAVGRSAYLTILHDMAPASQEIPPMDFSQTFRDSASRERLMSVLSGFFALLGLLLSGIGIYGLVVWNVTRRTTEIGLRMALGATRSKVLMLVMRQVAGLLAGGVLAGGIAAIFAGRAVRSFLYEIQPGDLWIFLLSAAALVFIGLFAALIPARRAISIDPMQALRTE